MCVIGNILERKIYKISSGGQHHKIQNISYCKRKNTTQYLTMEKKLKKGQVREDGKIFAFYHSNGTEYWLSPKKYHLYQQKKKKYASEQYKNPIVKAKKLAYAKTAKFTDSYLKRKYGISIEYYNNLHNSQNGACAICKHTCSSGRKLAVDHCHSTGRVRGLLCSNCNRGIGHLQDSVAILKSAVEYLSKVTTC